MSLSLQILGLSFSGGSGGKEARIQIGALTPLATRDLLDGKFWVRSRDSKEDLNEQ